MADNHSANEKKRSENILGVLMFEGLLKELNHLLYTRKFLLLITIHVLKYL